MKQIIIQSYLNPKYGWRYRIIDAEMQTIVVNDCQGMGFKTEDKALNYVRMHKLGTVVPDPNAVIVEAQALF